MSIWIYFTRLAAFRYRNFAVATNLAKTEAIQVVVVGAMLFAVSLSFWGCFSVRVGVIGVMLVSRVKLTVAEVFRNPGLQKC